MSVGLEETLAGLERFFDLKKLERARSDALGIQDYYRLTRHAYSRYHDPGNAVHMGLSEGSEFHPDDLKAQAAFVESRMPEGTQAVLEIATGRGMNTIWLARRHPDVRFHGIDLTEAQLEYARQDGADLENVATSRGDFHDLSEFHDDRFDVVFVVEALCHSEDKARVAKEVARVLRPGGRFVVVDGYRGRPVDKGSDAENRALQLLARGMAVAKFETYQDVCDHLVGSGLAIVEEQDRSSQLKPSLDRCARLADKYMKRPIAAWIMRRLLPRQLINTGVSGALFPLVLENGLFTYWITVLEKPSVQSPG